ARVSDAGHGFRRPRARRRHRLPHDPALNRGSAMAMQQSMTFPEAHPGRSRADGVYDWITTVDHKRIGVMYVLMALGFLVIGGFEAATIRLQLIRPHAEYVSPRVFNQLMTMHGTTMIFFVAIPLMFGFINYLVPLMVGARDMAFPRLNAFSFW